MFEQQSNKEQLNSIISTINSIQPRKNAIPAKWENVFLELTDFLKEYPHESNNDKLICSIVNFISNLDTNMTTKIFNNCMQIKIGYSHSLWRTCIAIEFERSKNYISALDIYEISIQRDVQPIDFLIENFNSFKERMLKRLYANYSLDLGTIDNDKYTFREGGIACKDILTNLPKKPKYDFLEIINFDHSKAKEYSSPQSFSKSRSSFISKPMSFQPDLSFNNISPPHFEEVEYPTNNIFQEQNHQSSFLSPTSQPPKQNSFSFHNQQFEPQEQFHEPENNIFHSNQFQFDQENNNNNNSQSRNLFTNNVDQSQTELSFQFNHVEPKRSILKKKSPSPSRNNNSGVKFNSKREPTNDKKRASTPVGKINKLEVGCNIFADIYEFQVIKQIGSNAFLATSQSEKYVIKRFPPNYTKFDPKYPFLFCLPIETVSSTFYITEFSIFGTFDTTIPFIHKSRVDETVAMFFLLQLLLIVDDLEKSNMTHGNICPEKLVNKLSENELPKSFDINDQCWQDVGIKLCACDEIHYNENIEDRKAVARLFYFLATKNEINDDFEKPPPRWNKEIWSSVFNTLQTKDSLDPLIRLVYSFIENNVMKLRSSLSRIYIQLFELQK